MMEPILSAVLGLVALWVFIFIILPLVGSILSLMVGIPVWLSILTFQGIADLIKKNKKEK